MPDSWLSGFRLEPHWLVLCPKQDILSSLLSTDLTQDYVPTRPTGLDKQKFSAYNCENFLPIIFNICFGCSKELSH